MMKNVYDEVKHYFEEEAANSPVVRRDWVEGFLRQKAWGGASEEELREIWVNLRMFLLYLDNTEAAYLEEIPNWEYTRVIQWLAVHVKGFKATLKPVRRFFNILIDFYRFLALKKILSDTSGLEQAAREIAGGKKIKLDYRNLVICKATDSFGDEIERVVNEIVEGLMLKLGAFFQRREFNDDFQRALFMFAGPVSTLPAAGPGEFSMFWQEFWDYFLFDYRLLASDDTPLEHFAAAHRNVFSDEERQIMEELLNARFTVFTIQRVLSSEWVECVNIFTEEKFRLPHPEFDYKTMKRLLFFGHVFARETVMVNYITSVEVSPNLRRRIKEEAQRQKAIFDIQQPGATWEDFFARHALAFRHTVDALITMAKVNVTPFGQLDRAFPRATARRTVNPRVRHLFVKIMPEYGFSRHDLELARRLWHDYSQLSASTIRKPGAWAAAVVYVYAQLNSPQGVSAEQLAVDFGVSTSSVYTNRDKIFRALDLTKFDPRYLNEEGFVYSLFMS